jgi:hypothetical protein
MYGIPACTLANNMTRFYCMAPAEAIFATYKVDRDLQTISQASMNQMTGSGGAEHH